MWSGPIYALRKEAQLNLAGKIRITYTVSGESFVEIIASQRAFSQLHMIYAAYSMVSLSSCVNPNSCAGRS